MNNTVILLFQQMADLTAPECAKCRVPHSCCSPEYCEIAREYAQDVYDIDLKPTDHPRLPFMGPYGCTVPPYLRPLCTLHTCDMNAFGCKKGDLEWTEKYMKLRDRIDQAMSEEYEKSP